MILNESLVVPLDELDKTKQIGLVINAEELPVFGRFFAHEGVKILKVTKTSKGFIRLFTAENMNRQEVSYDVKIVPTGYKIDPLDEYIDTIDLETDLNKTVKGHMFIQHSHPPRRKKK